MQSRRGQGHLATSRAALRAHSPLVLGQSRCAVWHGLRARRDFTKVELRIAKITAAERVAKSDKLLRLTVDLGEPEPRKILAGIGKSYEPERLIGKQVAVVANLPPRTMMGLQSQGMVLAASDETGGTNRTARKLPIYRGQFREPGMHFAYF
ncbi:MAG: hypothetical protein H6714_00680 [Myxococcales bacterium]|nr:hypothetical protein [Myxococcales bacterium]